MSNQPEPLRLAHEDDQMSAVLRMQPKYAPELRRLHAANVELFQELKNIAEANPLNWDAPMNDTASFRAWAQNRARAAIEKHGGQQCATSPTSI